MQNVPLRGAAMVALALALSDAVAAAAGADVRPVEVVQLRTESARTYRLADGQYLTKISASKEAAAPALGRPSLMTQSSSSPTTPLDTYIDTSDSSGHAGSTTLHVGRSAATGATARALLRFDLSGSFIPETSRIVFGALELTRSTSENSAAKTIGAYVLQTDFDGAANWNQATSTRAWTTPGGDFLAEPAGSVVVRSTDTKVRLPLTDVVQRWVAGDGLNAGVLLADAPDAPANRTRFHSRDASTTGNRPSLIIAWRYRTGEGGEYTFERFGVGADAEARVNVGNGNLMLEATQYADSAAGLPFRLAHTYNSMHSYSGDFGGWRLSPVEYRLSIWQTGSVSLVSPDGSEFPFEKTLSGNFVSPPEIDASLSYSAGRPVGQRYIVQLAPEAATLFFSETGTLTRIEYWSGRTVSVDFSSPPRQVLTDDTGRQSTVWWDNANGPSRTTLWDGTTRTYAYYFDPYDNGMLKQFTGADGLAHHEYQYNGSNVLSHVTMRDGHVTRFLSTSGRVDQVIDGTGTGGRTTSFAYGANHTNVTYPDGRVVTYGYDNLLKVGAKQTTSAPGVAAEGGLWRARNGYLAWEEGRVLRVNAVDRGGVSRVYIKIDGVQRGTTATCSSSCAAYVEHEFVLDSVVLSEATHTVEIGAVGVDGELGRETWTVTVARPVADGTPPDSSSPDDPNDPEQDPDEDGPASPELSAADRQRALDIIAADPTVQEIVAGRPHTIDLGPWTEVSASGADELVGATGELTFESPASWQTRSWPVIQYDDNPGPGDTYQSHTVRAAAADIMRLGVDVDFRTGRVVNILPDTSFAADPAGGAGARAAAEEPEIVLAPDDPVVQAPSANEGY